MIVRQQVIQPNKYNKAIINQSHKTPRFTWKTLRYENHGIKSSTIITKSYNIVLQNWPQNKCQTTINNKIRLHQIQRTKGAKSPISQLLFTIVKLKLQATKSNSISSQSKIEMNIICCTKINSIGQETKRESQFEVGCQG